MTPDPQLNDLQKRIETLQNKKTPNKKTTIQGNSFWHIGMELVASVLMGTGLGLFIDHIFGTKPWGLVAFFLLGSGAGLSTLYKRLTKTE